MSDTSSTKSSSEISSVNQNKQTTMTLEEAERAAVEFDAIYAKIHSGDKRKAKGDEEMADSDLDSLGVPRVIGFKRPSKKTKTFRGSTLSRFLQRQAVSLCGPVTTHGLEKKMVVSKHEHLDRLLDLEILERIGFDSDFADMISTCWMKEFESDRHFGCVCTSHAWFLCAYEDDAMKAIGRGIDERGTNTVLFLLSCQYSLWPVKLVVCRVTGCAKIIWRSQDPVSGEPGFTIRCGVLMEAFMNRLYRSFVRRNYDYIYFRNQKSGGEELVGSSAFDDVVPPRDDLLDDSSVEVDKRSVTAAGKGGVVVVVEKDSDK